MYISAHPSLRPEYLLRHTHNEAWISTQNVLASLNYHWARDALWDLGCFFAARHETILLPAYLCHSILDPFAEAGVLYTFYNITKDLTIDLQDIKLKAAQGAKALLIIHYNGIPQQNLSEIVTICQQYNMMLIEDCSECLFDENPHSRVGAQGQAIIYNYRKWLPLPDGATLVIRDSRLLTLQQGKKQCYSKLDAISTVDLLFRFIRSNYYMGDQWFTYHIHAKIKKWLSSMRSRYCYSGYNTSLVSQILLKRIVPSEVMFLRTRNYSWLRERLANVSKVTLLDTHVKGAVPRGVAILIKQRDVLQAQLARQGIETSVRWPLPIEVPSTLYDDAHWIAKHILVLPCHQDLTIEALEKLFAAFMCALL